MSAADKAQFSALNEFVPHEQTDADKAAEKWSTSMGRRLGPPAQLPLATKEGARRMQRERSGGRRHSSRQGTSLRHQRGRCGRGARAAEASKKKSGRHRKTDDEKRAEKLTDWEQQAQVASLEVQPEARAGGSGGEILQG